LRFNALFFRDQSLLFSNNEYIKDTDYANSISYRPFAKNLRVNQVLSLLNREYSKSKIRQGDFDIFHPTYYHPYFLKNSKKKPVVLTFHDTISEEFGQQYPDLGQGLTQRKKQCLDRADAIIAISEATKCEMLRWFEIDEKKITVIHHGNPFLAEILSNYIPQLQLPERYVLYIGERRFYKNFDRFIEAMATILLKDKDLQIVCAGSGGFNRDETALFEKHKVANRLHQIPIKNDSTLIELYKKAQVFVYPSLMEGFGIPILEAMACGCPVVASNGTSFNEIAGDSALYFEPKNTESICRAIESVAFDESKQKEMSAKGIEYAADFGLPKMAQATLNLYGTLI
jgi:glycosyltransferase involved in cell wall biosynthesis